MGARATRFLVSRGSPVSGQVSRGPRALRARGLLREHLDDRAARRRRARLYQQSWVVYAKRPFGGAQQLYRYLGRYTHPVAIGNQRLVSRVHPAFLAHILPRGFVKIRHTGLLAPTNVNGRLTQAKEILTERAGPTPASDDEDGDRPVPAAPGADLPWMDLLRALTGIDVGICPACHCSLSWGS